MDEHLNWQACKAFSTSGGQQSGLAFLGLAPFDGLRSHRDNLNKFIPMTHLQFALLRAFRTRSPVAALLMLSVNPVHARTKGCFVHCELQSAIGGLLIGLFFLYGVLVLNTNTKISARQTALYVAATVATGALAWTAAFDWLGMAAWHAAGLMAALVLAVFVYLFNPRRHRSKPPP